MGRRAVLRDLSDVVIDHVLAVHLLGQWSWQMGGCYDGPWSNASCRNEREKVHEGDDDVQGDVERAVERHVEQHDVFLRMGWSSLDVPMSDVSCRRRDVDRRRVGTMAIEAKRDMAAV
eukprot:1509-Pyramimonas_sp.AAC.2